MYMYCVHMTYATTTMSSARTNFAELLDSAASQVTIIQRRGKKDVAVFDADIVEDILSLSDKKLIAQIAKSRLDDQIFSLNGVFGDI